MTTHVLALVIVLGSAFLLGCEKSRTDNAPYSELSLNPRLIEVSPFIALMKANVDYRAESSCKLATVLSKLSLTEVSNDDLPDHMEVMSQIHRDFVNECEVYSAIKRDTREVFERISETGSLPEAMYAFSVFVPAGEIRDLDSYAEERHGLFLDMQSCNRLEGLARKMNMPTRRCRIWAHPE